MKSFFEHKIVVSAKDIDNLNHVNNAVYVKWMDDIASKHWSLLTKNHPDLNCIWVVNKHEITYKNQALLGDVLTAKTWIGETKGVTSERFIEFYKEDVLLVSSKTIWVLLDAKSFKPTRIRENVLKVLEPSK